MSRPLVFIDGQEGTTGLRIRQMLAARDDLELLLIPPENRKEEAARAEFLNRADLAILCLPDQAASDALELIESDNTRVIDTSSVRRVDPDWVYGLPEVCATQREAIRSADRVANCGCYPVGFILAVRPLIEAGVIDPGALLSANAVSGYSGGGRRMIEAYQQVAAEKNGDAGLPHALYSLSTEHKHMAEMQKFSLLESPPLFSPAVSHTYCGMLVSTPISTNQLLRPATPSAVYEIWREFYRSAPFVVPVDSSQAQEALRDGNFLDLGLLAETNRVELFAFGHSDQWLNLVGRLDNLGKGASGNAVQCLNLMLGFDEQKGL